MWRSTLFLICFFPTTINAQSREINQFNVEEIVFRGNYYDLKENPVRDVIFHTTWQNKGVKKTVYGFFAGDGQGRPEGDKFIVRFCPPNAGTWRLVETVSNDEKLHGQHQGMEILCKNANHPGFWMADKNSPGSRWYRRSDGSHPYIVGNTLYSFLSECGLDGPTGGTIENDIHQVAKYFNKIRFAITGDLYPHPTEKPFLTENGDPTDDGNYSHRPNPSWFAQRVDLAVQTCYDLDVIAVIILNGPDSRAARAALAAEKNGGDPEPFLRYIAARYGSYPNVWICLSNEYNIRTPSYTETEICKYGYILQKYLPYPTPVSVHINQQDWIPDLNRIRPWNDHICVQNKLKTLQASADFSRLNYWIGGGDKPVINDELAYEGAGDGWLENDVIEAFLGAFLGGSYASSGHKTGSKLGHYFIGNVHMNDHKAADNLAWMKSTIEEHIDFWKMTPTHYSHTNGNRTSIFRNIDDTFRALTDDGDAYVLGSNKLKKGVTARLPEGRWKIVQYDLINLERHVLYEQATGAVDFEVPDSRAVITLVTRIGD